MGTSEAINVAHLREYSSRSIALMAEDGPKVLLDFTTRLMYIFHAQIMHFICISTRFARLFSSCHIVKLTSTGGVVMSTSSDCSF